MDQRTQAYLESRLQDILSARGILMNPDGLMEVRRVLRRAQDVPPARMLEAERNLERLALQAASAASFRGAPSLSAADIREALASLCPFWPFC
jgi:hypothetical protein